MRDFLSRTEEHPREFGLIHADLGPHNWVFRGSEVGLIDFDQFGLGFCLYDLVGVLVSFAHWDSYEEHQDRLLTGYETVRPLPDCTKEQLGMFMAANFCAWMNHRLGVEDEQERREFARWLPFTAKMLARYCDQ